MHPCAKFNTISIGAADKLALLKEELASASKEELSSAFSELASKVGNLLIRISHDGPIEIFISFRLSRLVNALQQRVVEILEPLSQE